MCGQDLPGRSPQPPGEPRPNERRNSRLEPGKPRMSYAFMVSHVLSNRYRQEPSQDSRARRGRVDLVHLVCLVHLVSLVQPNKPNRPNKQERTAGPRASRGTVCGRCRHETIRAEYGSCSETATDQTSVMRGSMNATPRDCVPHRRPIRSRA